MKISCGVDIIEIERIKESIQRSGEKFLHTIFTEKEIEHCEGKKNVKYQHYAARFAAKEAAFKAISIFLEDKFSVNWLNAQITNQANGKPEIQFIGVTFPQIKSMDLSISHCKQYAIANVTILYEETI